MKHCIQHGVHKGHLVLQCLVYLVYKKWLKQHGLKDLMYKYVVNINVYFFY